MRVSKTSSGGGGARFTTNVHGGKSVRVSPGKGGHSLGTPRGCESKRAHSNVRHGYSGHRY